MLDADGLLAGEARTVSGKKPIRPNIDPNQPYAPRKAHFDMPAKQVLVIYCPGAVSHVEDALLQNLTEHPGQNLLLLRMHGVDQCDLSAIEALEGIVKLYRDRGGVIRKFMSFMK